MESEKLIVKGLICTLSVASGGLCELANAKRICDEEWICKPHNHTHENTGNKSSSGTKAQSVAATTTGISIGTLPTF